MDYQDELVSQDRQEKEVTPVKEVLMVYQDVWENEVHL